MRTPRPHNATMSIEDGLNTGKSWDELANTVDGDILPKHGKPSQYFLHMHIPKTGGTSFSREAQAQLPKGSEVLTSELCYDQLKHTAKPFIRKYRAGAKPEGVITMVRQPRSHVLSQYFHCTTSKYALREHRHEGPEFASFEHWVHLYAEAKKHKTELPYGCYHPINKQAAFFTCTQDPADCSSRMHYTPKNALKHRITKWDDDEAATAAIHYMNKSIFVGVMEAFQESLCLLHAQYHNSLPRWCNCENLDDWNSFQPAAPNWWADQNNHGTQEHSLKDYSPKVIQEIDDITIADQILYKQRVQSFKQEIQAVEKKFGQKVLCDKDLPTKGDSFFLTAEDEQNMEEALRLGFA